MVLTGRDRVQAFEKEDFLRGRKGEAVTDPVGSRVKRARTAHGVVRTVLSPEGRYEGTEYPALRGNGKSVPLGKAEDSAGWRRKAEGGSG